MLTCYRCGRTLTQGLEHRRVIEGQSLVFGSECIHQVDQGDPVTTGKAHRRRLERRRDLAAARMRRGRIGEQPATFWWLGWVAAVAKLTR